MSSLSQQRKEMRRLFAEAAERSRVLVDGTCIAPDAVRVGTGVGDAREVVVEIAALLIQHEFGNLGVVVDDDSESLTRFVERDIDDNGWIAMMGYLDILKRGKPAGVAGRILSLLRLSRGKEAQLWAWGSVSLVCGVDGGSVVRIVGSCQAITD